MKELTTIGEITTEQIEQLSKAAIIPSNTPPAQVAIFAQVCKEKGISPFQKHIYLVKYGNTYQTLMGIDGFRYIAGRTGQHVGTEITYNNGLSLDEVIQLKQQPRTARCIVKKAAHGVIGEFMHEVSMQEFKGSGKWKTMPFQMLGKCAEAFALKKAFPEHLSGLHIPEEKAAFENTTIHTSAEEMPDQNELFDKYADKVSNYVEYNALISDASKLIEDAMKGQMEQEYIENLKAVIRGKAAELKG